MANKHNQNGIARITLLEVARPTAQSKRSVSPLATFRKASLWGGILIALASFPLVCLAQTATAFTNAVPVAFPNADLEKGKVNWAFNEQGPMGSVVPEAARSGRAGLRINDADPKMGANTFSNPISAVAGQGYTLTFWARSSADQPATLSVRFFDTAGTNIAAYRPSVDIKRSDDWTQYTLLMRAPVTTGTLRLWIHTTVPGVSVTDFDDFALQTANGPTVAALDVPIPPPVPVVPLVVKPRKSPPYIVLKLDDLVSTKRNVVSDRWKKVTDFTRGRKIPATIGIICNSLEGDKPEYVNWIKEQHDSGLIEFWNHGYDHKQWEENGETIQDFKGPPYEQQLDHLVRSEALARDKLGFALTTFGAPFNATDSNTAKAMAQVPDFKVWLYGDKFKPAGKVVLDRADWVGIENPLFQPNLDKFIRAYNNFPDNDYFVIQGHADQWDDARFAQFVKIVDFLTEQKAVFTTPSEYVRLKNLGPSQPPAGRPAAVPATRPATVPAAVAGGAEPVAPPPVVSPPVAPATAGSLLTNGDFAAPLPGSWIVTGKANAQPQVVGARVEGQPQIQHALQLVLQAAPAANAWDVRLTTPPSTIAINKGDMLLLQFWGRATLKTRGNAVVQQSVAPNEKSIREVVSFAPQWQQYTYYAPARANYAPGAWDLEFQLGQSTGTLEFAALTLQNLGAVTDAIARDRFGARTVDYYGGEAIDDSWLPAANARIEKIRKSDLTLKVIGKDGKPVSGAKVTLRQTRSAFRWGSAVNYRLLEQSPDGDIYRSQVKRLFNTAVLENDLKWRANDGNKEVQDRARASVAWLRDNGLEVRAHNLVWGSARFLPARIKDLTADQARIAIKQRVDDAVAAYKGQVYVWDAVNEATTETELWDKVGWDTFADVFKWARAADPTVKLAYNDYNIANEAPDNGTMLRKVEARIQMLLDSGAPVDILGDQAHMSAPLTPLPRVLQIWDSWGRKYHRPIEITEFDAGIADDTVHEKYVRDFLTAAYSDPNVSAFLFWGFWEKAHWRGASGTMFRADWSPRPAQLAYENLVLGKWRTNAELTTPANGALQTRAFQGDYTVTVSSPQGNKTLTLKVGPNGLRQDVVLN